MKVYNFVKYFLVTVAIVTIAPAMIIMATPEVPLSAMDMGIYYSFFIAGTIGGGMSIFGDLILEMMGVEGVDPL